jgi:hypothetical protein
MGRREAGLGELGHQAQGRQHRPGRLPVVDHHPVAQPLHGHAPVLTRGPVDQHGQGLDERGGGRIALLFGEVGVADQVKERHRRDPLWPSQHAGRLELALDALDEMLGPRQLHGDPLDRPSCSSGTTASSSSRIGSSGAARANPIDLHIGVQERVGAVPDHQDAELDQPQDLDLGHAGEVGQPRCRKSVHAAVSEG